MVKPIDSQQVETMKTKSEVSLRVEVDAALHCSVGLVSSGISSVVTSGENRVVNMDTKHVEKLAQLQLEEPKRICESGL